MEPILSLAGIRKRFGALAALDGVSVRLAGGRVHGVLGENGAGKSTLMNVAYGMLRPDGGTIRVGGAEVRFRSPADAIAAGVGMVHQHFMLAGAMTVLDNVLLGDRRAGRLLDRRRAAERLVAMAEGLGLAVDPWARVERLSVGQQQRVEILKALWRDARVLILDEPTAVLTPMEGEQLFGAVERLRAEGRGVVFISHKLGEVKRICDDVTVLRRGRVVWEGEAKGVSAEELAREMVGRDVAVVMREGFVGGVVEEVGLGLVEEPSPRPSPTSGQTARASDGGGRLRERGQEGAAARLVLEGVSAEGLVDVALHVAPGEILGIAGVDGNGQQELSEVVVGLRRVTRGRVVWEGLDVGDMPPAARSMLGMGHIPNDRKREALAPAMSVTENVMLKRYRDVPVARRGVISWRSAAAVARRLVEEFDVRAESLDTPVGTLSGGNQQKVVLARELSTEPRLIVAMNPVRGLDVAATAFVYRQLLARRAAGAAILLISSEIDELLRLCDRIGVLYAGRLTMTDFPKAGRDEIGRLMAGVA